MYKKSIIENNSRSNFRCINDLKLKKELRELISLINQNKKIFFTENKEVIKDFFNNINLLKGYTIEIMPLKTPAGYKISHITFAIHNINFKNCLIIQLKQGYSSLNQFSCYVEPIIKSINACLIGKKIYYGTF